MGHCPHSRSFLARLDYVNALKEKITTLDTALESIYLASLHVDGIFESQAGKWDGVQRVKSSRAC